MVMGMTMNVNMNMNMNVHMNMNKNINMQMHIVIYIYMLPLKETLQCVCQERGGCTQSTPSCKVSTFPRGGPLHPILFSLVQPTFPLHTICCRYILYILYSTRCIQKVQ
jgi:hypothetical protein